jgi:hypothetical protein
MSRAHIGVASDLGALQTDLSAVVLADEPMCLDAIADAVVAALRPSRECSRQLIARVSRTSIAQSRDPIIETISGSGSQMAAVLRILRRMSRGIGASQ